MFGCHLLLDGLRSHTATAWCSWLGLHWGEGAGSERVSEALSVEKAAGSWDHSTVHCRILRLSIYRR